MPYNPWAGIRLSNTWAGHMSYSLGGEDYPLAYGTALPAPASGTLRTSGGSGEFACGWIGTAGRRSILMLDTPIGDMVAIVFQHQSRFGTHGAHYSEGQTCGWSGASANGSDWGGQVHLHVHGLRANGTRVQFTLYVGGSGGGGSNKFSTDTQRKLQQYVANAGLYSGPIDGALGVNSWRAIQQWLRNVGLYGGPIDGVPGTNTYKGLQRVAQQGGYGGPIDGVFGPNSEAALNVWLTRQLSPPPAADWGAWQTFLRAYGYGGPIDGVPGTNTYLALQKFLAEKFDYNGPIDGDPGPKTWEAFDRAKAAGYPNPKPPPPPPPPPDVFPAGEELSAGVDLGSSQRDFDFAAFEDAGGEFCILKMGGANASDAPYMAPHYLAQLSRARLTALIVGHYWMNGNKNGVTPTSAAQYYARHGSFMEGDLFALDVEAIDGVPAYTPDEVLEFTREFRKTFPGACFLIYLNRALLDAYDWDPVEAEGHMLWCATLDGTRDPDIREWDTVAIVQFKIAHTAGGAFETDCNIAHEDLTPLRWRTPQIPDLPAFAAALDEIADGAAAIETAVADARKTTDLAAASAALDRIVQGDASIGEDIAAARDALES